MLPAPIENSLMIAASMALLPCGHPDALREVQRQMRLINQHYPDATVLRLTDEVVRSAAILHGPPGSPPDDKRRRDLRAAVERLRACVENLPDPSPRPVRPRTRMR